jgi:spore maturation protein CgeB
VQRKAASVKLLLLGPGASWSTADVATGLRYGLKLHGVEVVDYALDARIARSQGWLHYNWRRAKKRNPAIPKPTVADVFFQAGHEALAMALYHDVDAVLAVSGMFLHPDVVVMMKRAHLQVFVVFTETPYDIVKELEMAKLVDGCWTNERSSVAAFQAVNPRSGYLPHAWHPERHQPGPQPIDATVAAHDVVFVGSGFPDRLAWLSSIDWTGIDLGLYGSWEGIRKGHALKPFVRGAQIDNATTGALYRRAKIGLNLYRTKVGWGRNTPTITHAESLNPRAYELAACGAFHLSSDRAEVREVFGHRVPTFQTPDEASKLIRGWLATKVSRQHLASELPACVAESSWGTRATVVIGDLQTLLQRRAA